MTTPPDEKPTSSLLHIPTAQDVKLYGDPAKTQGTCGDCKYFRLQAGQTAIRKERFLEKLVHDAEWQVRHLGAPPETLGLCTQGDASMLTARSNVSCENFKRGDNDADTAVVP